MGKSSEKRLVFSRGADEYVIGDVTFKKDGHSQAVSDAQYEVLKGLPDYDFTDISEEDRQAEVDADEAAAAEAEAVRRGSLAEQERLDEDARRRGAYYGAQSQAEIDAAGVTAADESHSPVAGALAEFAAEPSPSPDPATDESEPEQPSPAPDQHGSTTAPSESTGGSSPEPQGSKH